LYGSFLYSYIPLTWEISFIFSKLETQLDDLLLNFNYYLKDKNKHLTIYNTLLENGTADDKKLLILLNKNNLSNKEFQENMMYFFGDTLEDYQRKERFLKSLELILFSKNSLEEISSTCKQKRSPYNIAQFFSNTKYPKNNAVIRYNVG